MPKPVEARVMVDGKSLGKSTVELSPRRAREVAWDAIIGPVFQKESLASTMRVLVHTCMQDHVLSTSIWSPRLFWKFWGRRGCLWRPV